jgi:hypothetical protein
MLQKGGACSLRDTQTDIVVLQCGGTVTTSAGQDVGFWHRVGNGGNVGIDVELPNETVTCNPG